MPQSADGSAFIGDGDGAQMESQEPSELAMEIAFYGADPAITVAMTGAKEAAARAYFEHVKSDIIEAQRHNEPQVAIRPFSRSGDVVILDPGTIKQVVLIEGPLPHTSSTGDDDR